MHGFCWGSLVLLLASGCAAAAETVKNSEKDCTAVKMLKAAPPLFPSELKAAKARGTTELRLLIDVDGRVAKVLIEHSSGHKAFDDAALATASGWLFEPQRCDGKAEPSWALIPLRFDGSQAGDPLQIAEDERPLGFADVDAGVAYLALIGDIRQRPLGALATLYSSVKEQAIWTVVTAAPPARHRAITRWRVDTATLPPRQVYRFLCEGPAEWCAERLAQEKQVLHDHPMPPPPQ